MPCLALCQLKGEHLHCQLAEAVRVVAAEALFLHISKQSVGTAAAAAVMSHSTIPEQVTAESAWTRASKGSTCWRLSKSMRLPALMELALTTRSFTLPKSRAVSRKGATTFTAQVSSKPSSDFCIRSANTPAHTSAQGPWQVACALHSKLLACVVEQDVYPRIVPLQAAGQAAYLRDAAQVRAACVHLSAASR